MNKNIFIIIQFFIILIVFFVVLFLFNEKGIHAGMSFLLLVGIIDTLFLIFTFNKYKWGNKK